MTLDLMGGLLLTAALLVNAHAFLDALDIRRSTALWLAACFGLWVGLQISLYQVGAFQTGFAGLFPLIGLMVAAPVAATGIAAWRVPEVRRVLLAMPMETLIGLNVLRIFGFFFILLAADGRLAGPFPHLAGWGDLLVGVLALPLAHRAARGMASPAAVAGWNALGALDLLAAVTLGTLSSNGFAYQLLHYDEGSAAVQHLPWLLIPTVLVPFYLVTHGIILAQLRVRTGAAAAK
jgi:hypothetical protein